MRRSNGFTLLELLVAVSLLGLLAMTVVGAFTVGHRSVLGMADKLDANQQLRAAVKMMTDDLSFAKSIPGIVPFCYVADSDLYWTNGCEFTVRAYQPTANKTDPSWTTDFPDWPGDLQSTATVRIRYRLVDKDLIREIYDEANSSRVYSSRVLISGLSPYNENEPEKGSRFESLANGLVQVVLRMEGPTGGSADVAQVATVFYIR